jgi:hypothetical protein
MSWLFNVFNVEKLLLPAPYHSMLKPDHETGTVLPRR